jgi:ATP-dependent RNA helicase DDX19/DBP5
MSSEQSPSGASSLADRITKSAPIGTNPLPQGTTTAGSWADETASPVVTNAGPIGDVEVKDAQIDGAGIERGGSTLHEPEYDVEVKLSDIQADPNNPLYSVKTFDELGL